MNKYPPPSMMLIIGLVACLSWYAPLMAQEPISVEGYCNYHGEKFTKQIYSFTSDKEALDAVARILKYAGIEPTFETHAANVPNAMAAIKDKKRYIFYNQQFMADMKEKTGSEWAAISILAHEIAHHLQGHTIEAGGSVPRLELEADKYSGFILQKMDATLKETCIAMEMFGSEVATETHPAKSDRLLAIRNGWMSAKDLEKVKPDVTEPKVKKPAAQKPKPRDPAEEEDTPVYSPLITREEVPRPAEALRIVAKCVFNDGGVFLVLSNDQIVTRNAFGQTVPVATRVASRDVNHAWIYQTPNNWFGVTRQGQIVGNANGFPVQVGYVTNP